MNQAIATWFKPRNSESEWKVELGEDKRWHLSERVQPRMWMVRGTFETKRDAMDFADKYARERDMEENR